MRFGVETRSMIRIRHRIYLEDTDAGGIVYHTSYLRFMERARTEALRSAGFCQSDTFKDDLSFVLHSMNIRFATPALLDDEVEVSCALRESKGASLSFVQEVRSTSDTQLHCSAEVVVACISLSSKRPRRIPRELLDRLEAAAGTAAPQP
jgi:4-hydroxybenzoyl-CoA thioesterase